MAINMTTYTSKDEYEQVVGVNLQQELRGSSDHPERDAEIMLFRVERNMINYLSENFQFTESVITANEGTLNNFKLAVVYQVEWFITHGITTPTAVDEFTRQHPVFICEAAAGFLRTRGMMNIRRGR